MSEHATELTRERLKRVVENLGPASSVSRGVGPSLRSVSVDSLHVLLAAAEQLLAMKPASNEERAALRREAVKQWAAPFGNPTNARLADLEWRSAERRLLPFADETARDGNEP